MPNYDVFSWQQALTWEKCPNIDVLTWQHAQTGANFFAMPKIFNNPAYEEVWKTFFKEINYET